jgi:hypothetical protein
MRPRNEHHVQPASIPGPAGARGHERAAIDEYSRRLVDGGEETKMITHSTNVHIHPGDELIVNVSLSGALTIQTANVPSSVQIFPDTPDQLAPIAEAIIGNLSDGDRRDFMLRMCGGNPCEYFNLDIAEIARERI